ncbi:MAG TPA: hydroxylamine reductase [Victivallales bacterium]|nr:hydroxylamine reductase [Victivallales bacterium]HRU00676.1 hydroxylamine reductase [Victivallales bacterium]
MFCYQCEQTMAGKGCVNFGACGKDPDTAALQDLLVFVLQGISQYASKAYSIGGWDNKINRFIVEGLFTTVTNVNFDSERIEKIIRDGEKFLTVAKELYLQQANKKGIKVEELKGPAQFKPAADKAGLLKQALEVSIQNAINKNGADVAGLQQLIIYGLKGTAAYADHAAILGKEDPEVYKFFVDTLSFISENPTDINQLLLTALKVGEINLKVMGMLDAANTEKYGNPEPTKVRITPVAGKAILVSGHDLKDLHDLLVQTEGKGINVYTHGEMLPCHAYPELKKFKHLVGNYGGAWQDQRKEFDEFPGAILMTTNCIQKPKDSYKSRIFTSGLVGWPGVKHISNSDFSPVIEAALQAEGFKTTEEEKTITVGFGHNAVLGVAGAVIDAVKAGKINHFFLIGGCDGAKPGRNYYTEFAEKVPNDCVILTLACGKYRFNKKDFGEIGGIPRLLDIGQCNDAYSAIKIAIALADAFKCGVNELPLSMILSWYEQKAVCILLTLLHLGIKNIRLGPSLPAFVTPTALNVLVEKFNIMPIKTPEEDLQAILKK